MFEITVLQEFAAAHKLYQYEGDCKNIHGHTWKVAVTVYGEELDNKGMLYDFRDLKKTLNIILEKYEHTYLNEIEPFDLISPTAENLAKEIYNNMGKLCKDCKIKNVKVWESANSCATYYRSE
ncbi:hypothetical protein SYNTR_0680 [Candidatus Syntrophocurvum alkaliphilum]|uniref:6-carboxy-5,6,7,8-tetrahydropterin synthase n=1 Tax=Candidatus Syntrophocurvum alkaliphilum TaxID=2293317 RepID=A0A6I6DFW7_9FIRM|nr:6-carboxytetrahydropterin synthase QueD [Candidatus Syntrophocurvum alkaliphilum]QGT99273.1 hypothetical protein SYNTR_0680 [Candidatus Syntrophocurvum alkaliphilum]